MLPVATQLFLDRPGKILFWDYMHVGWQNSYIIFNKGPNQKHGCTYDNYILEHL